MAGWLGPLRPLSGRLATHRLVGDPRHLGWPGDPGRGRYLVHVVGFFEPVLDQQLEVVTLIEDFAVDVGVELFQPTNLPVLLGDQLLIHRGDFDEEVVAREVEIRCEEPGRLPFFVPGDREGARLIGPLDSIEVEKSSELTFTVMGKLSDVCRAGLEYVVGGQIAPTSPAAATAACAPVASSSGNNW